MMVRAYTYLLSLGKEGVHKVGEYAILNANYLRHKLEKYYDIPYGKTCMHEFVISARKQKEKGVSALYIAKKLLDYGFHAPTILFPFFFVFFVVNVFFISIRGTGKNGFNFSVTPIGPAPGPPPP